MAAARWDKKSIARKTVRGNIIGQDDRDLNGDLHMEKIDSCERDKKEKGNEGKKNRGKISPIQTLEAVTKEQHPSPSQLSEGDMKN